MRKKKTAFKNPQTSDLFQFTVFFQEAFSDIALFFYDVFGGDFVGVIWKPHSFVPAQFKVLTTLSYFSMSNAIYVSWVVVQVQILFPSCSQHRK